MLLAPPYPAAPLIEVGPATAPAPLKPAPFRPAPPRPAAPRSAPPGSAGARRAKRRVLPALMVVGALAGIGLLVAELSAADPSAMLRTMHPGWLAAALASTAVSLLAAAHNLHGFATVPLRMGATLRAQLAIGFTRILMPSAVTTPAVASRYLNRRGAPWPIALGTVSAAQLTQLIVTTVIVGVLSVTSAGSHTSLQHVHPLTVAAVAGGVVVAVVSAVLIARKSAALRKALRGAADSWAMLRRHAREHPGRIAVGVVSAAALTGAHILAFACCVYAVGGHATPLALAVVYLASSAAGSLIPTPGGTGAVEAALVAGLTASGLPLPVAAAAALLSRLESVWLPAVPGWWAMRSMRRDGLL